MMARNKKNSGMDAINKQIEEAQEAIIRAQNKYEEATDHLKLLIEKRKELQAIELMDAVLKSRHSYEEIIRFIKSDKSDTEE